MRGAIFIPAIAQTEWVREVLPGTSPAELPVAGRRFIDYLLEAAQRRGLDMAEVTDWHPSPRLADEFSSLTRTVIPVFYRDGAGDLPRGLDDIPAMQGPLSSRLEEGIVAVWGLVLPLHPPGETTLEPITPAERANTPPGIYRHTGDGWMRVSPHGFPARDVKSWFDLNMTVAETPCGFTLPGYSSEDGVHLGSNVVLERGTEASPPVILGDNSWCGRFVTLGGNVVVGGGAVISEGTTLRRTVVCDNTFVGPYLDLTDKIVVGNRIIDGRTGTWTDLEEESLAHDVHRAPRWLHAIANFLAGTSRGRRC